MGIKKRNKVSAEFSMSSLTDIIFLLLIFFMLTSSLVAPNALNLKLPGNSKVTVTQSRLSRVSVSQNGAFYLDGVRVSGDNLRKRLLDKQRKMNKPMDIIIAPDPNSPNEKVVQVMDIAYKLKINAVLATK